MTLLRGDGGAAAVVCERMGECGGASDQWRGREHAVCMVEREREKEGGREREREEGREGGRER